MSRIDEALRRAEPGSPDTAIVNRPQAGEAGVSAVFTSPWTFGADEKTPDHEAVAAPAIVADGDLSTLPKDAMALFKGFRADVVGRIVAAPGAPPVLAEQFRRLAAALHHLQLSQGTKIIMVTSANPGDGKTLTSTNLALTLSESYRRQVLLIDADLRRPSLHEIFQLPNLVGLNDGLQSASEGRLDVIKITDSLTLLPAGRPNPDPMSALASDRMREVLREAASRFDWVIVDTAPLGLLADANLLTTMIDGALLVIRANATPHANVERALESLGRSKVLGVVLNAVDPTSKDQDTYGRGYLTDTPSPPLPAVQD